jgi:hypothetical protein
MPRCRSRNSKRRRCASIPLLEIADPDKACSNAKNPDGAGSGRSNWMTRTSQRKS